MVVIHVLAIARQMEPAGIARMTIVMFNAHYAPMTIRLAMATARTMWAARFSV